FTWEGLDGAATALHRLRTAAHEWGATGTADGGDVDRFPEQNNDNLNMPRAVALTWELVRSALPAATKKATLLQFDRVFGLRLAEWHPVEATVPEAIWVLVQQRQQARVEKSGRGGGLRRGEGEAAG